MMINTATHTGHSAASQKMQSARSERNVYNLPAPPQGLTEYKSLRQWLTRVQNLCKPKPDQIPAWKGEESWHTINPTMELMATVSCYGEERPFSLSVVPGKSTTLQWKTTRP